MRNSSLLVCEPWSQLPQAVSQYWRPSPPTLTETALHGSFAAAASCAARFSTQPPPPLGLAASPRPPLPQSGPIPPLTTRRHPLGLPLRMKCEHESDLSDSQTCSGRDSDSESCSGSDPCLAFHSERGRCRCCCRLLLLLLAFVSLGTCIARARLALPTRPTMARSSSHCWPRLCKLKSCLYILAVQKLAPP